MTHVIKVVDLETLILSNLINN